MLKTRLLRIDFLTDEASLWRITLNGSRRSHDILAPEVEIDGTVVRISPSEIRPLGKEKQLRNGSTEYAFSGPVTGQPDLQLRTILRVSEHNPVVRFRYILESARPRKLTKSHGRDGMRYLGLSLGDLANVKEIRLSEFRDTVHSYSPSERTIGPEQFENALSLMGPLLSAGDGGHTFLLAYEHGSQIPDAFLSYDLAPDRSVHLSAVKGNYYHARPLAPGSAYETIWFHFAAVDGDERDLAEAYRTFILKHQSESTETRRPYIFYNTWNLQERDKWFNGRDYLDAIKEDRILKEIDLAARMGIEVFVIDTGWYVKTGDWRVNTDRFTGNLKAVKKCVDRHGMRLGLWFDPTAAAVSSEMARKHRDCVQRRDGEEPPLRAIWGTEQSYTMCLVSPYADSFADELIRLARETGVTYFKWDAIQQYGCDSPDHDHGTSANSPQERAECFAFELPRVMGRIAERLGENCGDAIVDFDVTEAHRAVGLGFLASGKFFLINNGPYYRNYDLPTPPPGNSNMFFYPGPARARICRVPLSFDKWVPSVLFMTHYFPDDPQGSQMVNLASLILGQNGIWGDLTSVSDEGIERIARIISLYKRIRDDITESFPVRTGAVGGSPEIHEKISRTGRGVICCFADARGEYHYVSKNKVDRRFWATDGAEVEFDSTGRAKLTLSSNAPGAHIIFFGAE